MVYSEHRFLANLKSCPVPHGSLLSTDNSYSPLKNESLGNANNNEYLPVYLIASFLYFCHMFFLRHRLQLCSTQHRGNPPFEPSKWSQKGKQKKNIRERGYLLPQEVNLQPASLEDLLLLSYRRMQLLLQHQSILLLALLQQATIASDLPWRST